MHGSVVVTDWHAKSALRMHESKPASVPALHAIHWQCTPQKVFCQVRFAAPGRPLTTQLRIGALRPSCNDEAGESSAADGGNGTSTSVSWLSPFVSRSSAAGGETRSAEGAS